MDIRIGFTLICITVIGWAMIINNDIRNNKKVNAYHPIAIIFLETILATLLWLQ